jgi:hypothetical protein
MDKTDIINFCVKHGYRIDEYTKIRSGKFKLDMNIRYACYFGQLELVKHLMNTYICHLQKDLNFSKMCNSYNSLPIAEWFYKEGIITEKKFKSIIQKVFVNKCRKNDMESLKSIYNIFAKYINVDSDLFKISFETYNLDVAKWIYSIDNQCMRDIDYQKTFNTLCICRNKRNSTKVLNKRFNFIQFLYDIDKEQKINIHDKDDWTFRFACGKGNLMLAKWLYSLDGKINHRIQDNNAMKHAVEYNHVETVDWLNSL